MKLLSIIGARPQFVKAAVVRKYCLENSINETLLHTGQHYDDEMTVGIFDTLNVKRPDIQFTLSKRTHGGMTAEMLEKIETVITETKPDIVNVYGDTNSTLAGALAAAKLHVPVMHIEAGLRSFNKMMPEEINRILTDHMSHFLFCPTQAAVQNLHNENLSENVFHVGDVMYDAVKVFGALHELPSNFKKNDLKQLAILTIHRAEAVQDPAKLQALISYCQTFVETHQIVFPCHPNTLNKLRDYEIDVSGIEVIEAVDYLEMQALLREADLVLTDSGGLQKEAYFHGCECITLRNETEWVETIDAGWNHLWTSDAPAIEKKPITEYGNGACVEKIFSHLI